MSEKKLLPVLPDEPAGTPPIFERVAIVGLGLVGGSLALAARRRWPRALVIGVDRGRVLEEAVVRHAIDVASEELMIASEADLVILAAPVRENIRVLESLPKWVAREAVVTDVGSTKREIVSAATTLPARLTFVGGHPLAGAAHAGIEYARPDLFEGRPWLFTPSGEDGGALSRLSAFAEGLGAVPRVIESPAAHDHLVALLSHLPQLAVSALMQVVGEGVGADGLALAGRGLVDTTRLASSPASAWKDVCATNQDEITSALDAFIGVLRGLRDGLASGEAIESVFRSAAEWRSRLTERE
jgi:prephenate dehydrogenase